MKSLFTTVCILALLSAAALAQAKADIIGITKDSYTCRTCTPEFTVNPDGHAYITKRPGFDAVAVRLVSNGATEIRMKGGKVVMTITTSVSPDGRTATTDFSDTSSGTTQRGFVVARRVDGSPKRANPASGVWQVVEAFGAKLTR